MATLQNSTIPNGGTLGSAQDTDAFTIASDGQITTSQPLHPYNFVGMIAPFAYDGSPTGWLDCNGASVSTSTYAELFAVIGYTWGGSGGSFNVPELRGEFLRGWSNGTGTDPGRSFASAQGHALEGHAHHMQSYAGHYGIGPHNPRNGAYGQNGPYGDSCRGQTLTNQPGYPSASWAPETRPRNVAVKFMIKY